MSNDNNKKEVDLRSPLEKGRLLLSITEFCQCVGISRVTYYAWKREGIIPAEGFETRLGAGIVRISFEAMLAWMRARGAPVGDELLAVQQQIERRKEHSHIAVGGR